MAREWNFDGIVGPTHNYSGLSFGNIASTKHQALVSNPKEAALQGLKKMRILFDRGIAQAFLPPHERPNLHYLRRLGFSGKDSEVLSQVSKKLPWLLSTVSSASSMWTANCATVVPSSDSKDGKTHFTVANLNNKFHRCIEHETSFRILKSVFADESHFVHHTALTPSDTLGDEGAANHTRFCKTQDGPGFHFWVYGKQALAPHKPQPKKFPARQTREACECLVEQSGLSTECFLFAQQDPKTIDKGVFHNDVISVGNGGFFLCHEKAFLSQKEVLKKLKVGFQKRCGDELQILIIKESELSVKDAVSSYLFNSQLISTTKDKMLLVAPIECEKNPKAKALCKKITADKKNPIDEILFLDLRQSMNNGGGPACLRLRVVLSNEEEKKCNQKVLLNNKTFDFLEGWIKKYYRDKLSPSDLADPKLLQESRQALDELSQFLHLGNIYEFQKN